MSTNKNKDSTQNNNETYPSSHQQQAMKKHEAILSYYKSPRASSNDRSGWIFLSDVISLQEACCSSPEPVGLDPGAHSRSHSHSHDKRRKNSDIHSGSGSGSVSGSSRDDDHCMIYIKHPSRAFRLEAMDYYQHRLWFDTLKRYCSNATFGIYGDGDGDGSGKDNGNDDERDKKVRTYQILQYIYTYIFIHRAVKRKERGTQEFLRYNM